MLRLISLSDYFMRELENPTKRLPTMVDIDRALWSCLQNGTAVRSHWALILLLLFFDLKTWSRAFQTVTPSFWTSAFTVDNEIYTSVSLKGEFFSGFHSTARVHNWTSAIFHFESFPPRNSKWSCMSFSCWGAWPCLLFFLFFLFFLLFLFFFFSFLSFLSAQTFIVENLVQYSILKVWFQYFSIILFTCLDTLYFILEFDGIISGENSGSNSFPECP